MPLWDLLWAGCLAFRVRCREGTRIYDLITPSMGASVQGKIPHLCGTLWALPFTGCCAKELESPTLSPLNGGFGVRKNPALTRDFVGAEELESPTSSV